MSNVTSEIQDVGDCIKAYGDDLSVKQAKIGGFRLPANYTL